MEKGTTRILAYQCAINFCYLNLQDLSNKTSSLLLSLPFLKENLKQNLY